uniref:C-type lectin domain-containing protein n=1 Tax=Eptatretus burgeri TaxID=7764 RepID=A0A8C4Q270_EPTBU
MVQTSSPPLTLRASLTSLLTARIHSPSFLFVLVRSFVSNSLSFSSWLYLSLLSSPLISFVLHLLLLLLRLPSLPCFIVHPFNNFLPPLSPNPFHIPLQTNKCNDASRFAFHALLALYLPLPLPNTAPFSFFFSFSLFFSATLGCLRGRWISGRCYLLFREYASHEQAASRCEETGGSLAAPSDATTRRAIARYARSAVSGNWFVWIGVTDHTAEGVYIYSDGSRVISAPWYRAYPVVQPNGGHAENCVVFTVGDGAWWDSPCNGRHLFLCQYAL